MDKQNRHCRNAKSIPKTSDDELRGILAAFVGFLQDDLNKAELELKCKKLEVETCASFSWPPARGTPGVVLNLLREEIKEAKTEQMRDFWIAAAEARDRFEECIEELYEDIVHKEGVLEREEEEAKREAEEKKRHAEEETRKRQRRKQKKSSKTI